MVGYHSFERLSWIDAFANAAMILSGMGPLAPLTTTGGKLFAGFYALFSGLALITIAGVVFAPVVHRFLHRFHLEHESGEEKERLVEGARRGKAGDPSGVTSASSGSSRALP